ncbi:MAG: hypothetical protein M3Q40_09740 [Pseudomonadota bacterium]|nr:hypothetical protein [Pseudomonadota bacterium]
MARAAYCAARSAPDANRITANVFVVAIHAAALLMLLMPMDQSRPVAPPPTTVHVDWSPKRHRGPPPCRRPTTRSQVGIAERAAAA